MINLAKTYPEPADLARARTIASGTYRTDGVVDLLEKDFHNKCYLCGQKAPTGINIEHFEEHRGDRTHEMAWHNLYFACSHCNSCKNGHGPILNCLNPAHRVATWLEYGYQPFPVGLPFFRLSTEINADFQAIAESTVLLQRKIFLADDPAIRKLQANNLSKALEAELLAFDKILGEIEFCPAPDRQARLRQLLAPDTAFTAFKYWWLRQEFPEWLAGLPLAPHLEAE